MGRTFEAVDDPLRTWIARQPMFFVGTATLGGDGHVNVSPKGPIGTLRVLGPRELAYRDLVGSGAETIAHLRENGRIVVMLCAFEGPPRIVRLHGRGEVLLPGDDAYAALETACALEDAAPPQARRAIVRVDVARIARSCGYGVPEMTPAAEREHFPRWAGKRLRVGGPEALLRYQEKHDARSIDGLPAVPARR